MTQTTTNNMLIMVNVTCCATEALDQEMFYIKSNFAGEVQFVSGNDIQLPTDTNRVIYLCGNITSDYFEGLERYRSVKVVKGISNVDGRAHSLPNLSFILIGEVPINVHGLGIMFREHFIRVNTQGYYETVVKAHKFQNLTEGNKSGSSFRKGIYLTRVEKDGENDGGRSFHLLRCSTNLDGPTENFRPIDEELVHKANTTCDECFDTHAPLNHVLAQIYENSFVGNKEKKARIKAHSDKTKDMPENGLIAFCTFYSKDLYDISSASPRNVFDRVYKQTSVLTRLRFKLKTSVTEQDGLPEHFNITLYDNSMFVIPLSTNRLYTHEIAPPSLPSDKIPTRLGYVIRCSKTEATHKAGATCVKVGDEMKPLVPPTEADRAELKELYLQENLTDKTPEYDTVLYSMNTGDYLEPVI